MLAVQPRRWAGGTAGSGCEGRIAEYFLCPKPRRSSGSCGLLVAAIGGRSSSRGSVVLQRSVDRFAHARDGKLARRSISVAAPVLAQPGGLAAAPFVLLHCTLAVLGGDEERRGWAWWHWIGLSALPIPWAVRHGLGKNRKVVAGRCVRDCRPSQRDESSARPGALEAKTSTFHCQLRVPLAGCSPRHDAAS